MSHSESPTQENLAELLAYWQRILRLADWDITIEVLPIRRMNHSNCQGQVHWELHEKTASIALVEAEEAPDCIRPYDMEATLVHELLHLHFSTNRNDSNAEETAINMTAHALTKLNRRTSP